ncbi:MAG: L-rhamnose isomerase [Armatimonadetes bacterium]|nr:L-rhamnose isomerase [Armatimonadota bacterium]
MPTATTDAYHHLADRLQKRGVNLDQVKERLKAQRVETPSWGYSDSGTRFGVFKQPGAAITIQEKLEDAAMVNRMTGITPDVAMHVLWDLADDLPGVKRYAESLGVRIGSINPNVFQDQEYKFGSLANPDPAVRRKAVDHMLDCVEIAKQVDSSLLSLWFADGTSYPGQGDFRQRKHWFQEGLKTVYDRMPDDMTMLVEYKFFEPAFYHTDIADWGMAYCFSRHLGDRAKVLVDLGHHALSTNIEHIVAFLLDEGMLGGFHFNNRRYADDDLTVGSTNPYELFLIYHELARAEEGGAPEIAYMIDQSANLKRKIEDMVQTVMQIQTAYAKALTVDLRQLRQAQSESDVLMGERALQEAFGTDVEPLLSVVREEMDVPADPFQAYRESGYQEKIEKERGIRQGAGGLGQ